MRDFRGPLPLTDADFAAIRRSVLEKVEKRAHFSLALRLAFAIVIAAYAGIAVWIARQESISVPLTVPRFRSAVAEPPLSNPKAAALPPHSESTPPRRRVLRKPPQPMPPIRIEIRTADPDIRIIWIANQNVSSEEKS